ncbi:MAG TPA: c-type cytochrome [Allosphingosinicella sp.]|nr:c-type cytochrome [Allosphingosinicella sp.]
MKAPPVALALAAVALAGSLGATAAQQPGAKQEFVWPARISNAKVLPADIGQERLRTTMVGFARSLGVRCTFCHVGPEGAPLSQLDFASDANPHKELARGMIRMVQKLNREDLPAIVGESESGRPRVTCYTCHRGSEHPETQLPPPPPRPAAAATPPQPTPAS